MQAFKVTIFFLLLHVQSSLWFPHQFCNMAWQHTTLHSKTPHKREWAHPLAYISQPWAYIQYFRIFLSPTMTNRKATAYFQFQLPPLTLFLAPMKSSAFHYLTVHTLARLGQVHVNAAWLAKTLLGFFFSSLQWRFESCWKDESKPDVEQGS